MKSPALSSISLVLLALLPAPQSVAQQPRALVDLSRLGPSEHRTAGFVLSRPQFLQLEAIGAEPRGQDDEVWWSREGEDEHSWPAAAWIIETSSRAVVWDLRRVTTNRLGKGLRLFTGPIRLPAGVYEVHFASYVTGSVYERDRLFEQFRLSITGPGRPARPRELKEPVQTFLETAFLRLTPDSGSVARLGFEVTHPVEVEVLALGELRQRRSYDYGWIQNADTRQLLWRMEWDNTTPAGGTARNRMARDTLHLAAGRYVATFVNDESHRAGAWRATPAVDPVLWGLTLRVKDVATRRSIRKFPWQPVPEGQTIVSLRGIGDDELRSQGFFLRQTLDVRIYAMGECNSLERDIDDGAWLMDLTRKRRAWEMRCNQTLPAGGATKNRLVDTLLRLERGNYTLFYKSDGSHSAKEWNSAPPAEPAYWGVSLFPASERLAPGLVGPPERDTVGIIAELIRVRDDRKSRRFFSLEAPTQVRIHALGEATGGDMHDFGWIENGKTGAKVWTMEYAATRPAGGAEKNRLLDSVITLPPGRYVLHYQTDGSHAFGEWNADPPDDPDSWGITLRRVR